MLLPVWFLGIIQPSKSRTTPGSEVRLAENKMRLFSSFQSHLISVANLPGRKIQPQVLEPVNVCRSSYIRSSF